MHIDENVTWKQHIAPVKKDVSIALFFLLKQVKHVLPPDSLRILYFALIEKGNINNTSYYSHTDLTFKKLGILKLYDLFDYRPLLLVHDYLSNKLPSSFNGCFPTNRSMKVYRRVTSTTLIS